MADERFPKTSWTLIARAGAGSLDAHAALTVLCSLYWFPVYAFIRRQGGNAEDAYDRTQSFFVQMLERGAVLKADREYGSKFRSWLLRCVKNFLTNEYAYTHAQRRQAPEMLESLTAENAKDRYDIEPYHNLTPERLYEREFALNLLAQVMEKLREKYVGAGRVHVFDALKGCLSDEVGNESYEQIATTLNMSTVAVRKAAFDLRQRYKNMLYAEVANIVDSEDDDLVGKELHYLLEALSD